MNGFENTSIWHDRIQLLYINKNILDTEGIDGVKREVERKLENMAERLYNDFYTNQFVYQIKGQDEKYVTVQLVDDNFKDNLGEQMFIVNN